MRCRTAHLALLIFSELGQTLPSLSTDTGAHPAPLPVMASGGDRGKHPYGGSTRHDNCHCHPTEQGQTPPSAGHLHWLGESLLYVVSCLGMLLHHDAYLCMLIGFRLLFWMRWPRR
jgi:hypothetical protein